MDTQNPLTLIPPKVRLALYLILFLVSVGLTSVAAYFTALNQDVPDWCIGGAAALVPVMAAFTAVAASNTQRNVTPQQVVVNVPANVDLVQTDHPVESVQVTGDRVYDPGT